MPEEPRSSETIAAETTAETTEELSAEPASADSSPIPEDPDAAAAGASALEAAKARGLRITTEFQDALDRLERGEHLFLTGKAGTGKSTLITTYVNSTERTTITVAPTGIAALNVGGYTIHRFFSFPPRATESYARSPRYSPRHAIEVLSTLDTLIVDEASMVRADLFDAMAAALERFGPRPGEPFGGVQVVLVGDLYQLPPVISDQEKEALDKQYATPFFFSARHYDLDLFSVVELTEVFRQEGDARFLQLLNDVRAGTLLDDARVELNQRVDPDFEAPSGDFWMTLTTTNRIADARNRKELEKLPGPITTHQAVCEIEDDLAGGLTLREIAKDLPVAAQLQLAPGAQVMLLTNDPLDRWVNGTLGQVVSIHGTGRDTVVEVELRGGKTVSVSPHDWDITRPVSEDGRIVHRMVATFTQLPLRLAWAITIHKSQGQTLDHMIVDLTGGTFANGQLYVALSRCRSLDGLVLRREIRPLDLQVDQRVKRFLTSGDSVLPSAGEAYLGMLTVGNVGRVTRPRPIEIAVVTDAGDEITTVINPTSDLYNAAESYGITTRDVQLAPVLSEAWPALSSLLAGRVLVSHHADDDLAFLDYELKRNGVVALLPPATELPSDQFTPEERTGLRAANALERAHALRAAHQRLTAAGISPLRSGEPYPETVESHGYLLARTTGPLGTTDPTGFVVGGQLLAGDDQAAVLEECLQKAWARQVTPDQDILNRIRAVEKYFEIRIAPEDVDIEAPPATGDVLVPGARVCFTGSVTSARHGKFTREDMQQLATDCGLVPVQSVTKTKTDLLVVAAIGTQSGKARKAHELGKPVITAEEFLDWATSQKP